MYIYIYTHFITIHYSPTIHRSNTGPQGPFSVLRVAPKEGVHHDVLPISLSIYLSLSIYPSIHPSRSIHLSISIYLKMWMLPDTKLRRFTLCAPAVLQRPRVPRLVARDSAAEVQDLPRQEPVQQRNGLLALARFDFSEGERKDLFRAKYGRFPYHNSSRKKPPEGKEIHRSNCRSSCGQLRRTLLIG